MEKQVYGAVAIVAARIINQLTDAVNCQGQVLGWLADVNDANLNTLAVSYNDDGKCGRGSQGIP
jgi:hypothetical protein